eukprot:TRINITY_DN14851_c0_g1_i1.p1 TRINITY_DN14851_c0_g1~~TRINITY_DN14851_c0_g1_i1.p1  ORF type:complete len:427 (+),score=33.93 TRINITY_DN14851_c0_g1_i1:81-1361(+)
MSQNFISTENFQSVIENIITTNILSNSTAGVANNPANSAVHPNPSDQISEPTHDIELGRRTLDNNNTNNNMGIINPLFTDTTAASNPNAVENNSEAPVENNNNINNINDNNANINANGNINNPPQNGPRTHSIDFSLSSVSKVLAYVAPFLVVFLTVFIVKHIWGFLVFAWLYNLLIKANDRMKQEVAKRENRDKNVFGGIIIVLALNFAWPLFIFRATDHLYQGMLFMSITESYDLWQTLWNICVTDTLVKYIAIIIKSIYAINLGHKPPFRKRATMYSFIETLFACYRTMLPIPLWVNFLLSDWEYSNVLSGIAIMFYLILKFPRAYEKTMVTIITFKAVVKGHLRFGTYATREQVQEVGDQCSICQEAMTAPVILSCKHIFCEECVGAWFEKEKTCPLCRAQIEGTGNLIYADGTTTLVPEIF